MLYYPTNKMKAVAFRSPGGPVDTLQDIELEKPEPMGRDLLVKVHAVSVNPIDTKVRSGLTPNPHDLRVLGFDAAGVVESRGPDCKGTFHKGEEVFYAGALTRQGTNSEYHLVDERIVGHKPNSLTMAKAAALPLTSITAWEMLFDRLSVNEPTVEGGRLVLIIGGAGGVGSMAIQLLRAMVPDMVVIATASRPETQAWVKELGAHHVIDHSQPMAPQIDSLNLGSPGFVFSTTHTEDHLEDIVKLMAPQGRFGMIDDVKLINAMLFKNKSISLHWELMFTRSIFETPDIEEQCHLLNKLAVLVDSGKVQTTATEIAGLINAANLQKVHALIETHKVRGKIVLQGFH